MTLLIPDLPLTPELALQQARQYPPWRFMGSKHRLLPWLHDVLSGLPFETALDAFSGSGCVAYLLKSMGKTVITNDFLRFAYTIGHALIENPGHTLSDSDLRQLLEPNSVRQDFISTTFKDIFFPDDDNVFLDNTWANLPALDNPYKRSLAIASMCRAAIKKQPRGVFTINGANAKHHDGRRDLKLSLQEHFVEAAELLNGLVRPTKAAHQAGFGDVFDAPEDVDLVYLDPPYVPRSDDNCYIKRYHFVEGLSCYWQGLPVLADSKVKKIAKRFTPFSYRRSAIPAFDRLFHKFRSSTIVLSYSSTSYPDQDTLVDLLKQYKRHVQVHALPHRYHFGTHQGVRQDRALVQEYLFVAT